MARTLRLASHIWPCRTARGTPYAPRSTHRPDRTGMWGSSAVEEVRVGRGSSPASVGWMKPESGPRSKMRTGKTKRG
eukprot:scaffold26215_cov107-Isochrysis_galbana.AAC.1